MTKFSIRGGIRRVWRGPAKVLGKESNLELVRHGTSFYRCHHCHVLKVSGGKVAESAKKMPSPEPSHAGDSHGARETSEC